MIVQVNITGRLIQRRNRVLHYILSLLILIRNWDIFLWVRLINFWIVKIGLRTDLFVDIVLTILQVNWLSKRALIWDGITRFTLRKCYLSLNFTSGQILIRLHLVIRVQLLLIGDEWWLLYLKHLVIALELLILLLKVWSLNLPQIWITKLIHKLSCLRILVFVLNLICYTTNSAKLLLMRRCLLLQHHLVVLHCLWSLISYTSLIIRILEVILGPSFNSTILLTL